MMHKRAVLSLLVAGLITGSYIEFQMNQGDGVADSQVIEGIDVGQSEAPPEPTVTVEPPRRVIKIEPPRRVIQHVPLIPPPPEPEPTRRAPDVSDGPTFTPYTEAPSITNREEVVRAMVEAFPPLLRDAGIGGTVRMYFFIQADGSVGAFQIDRSSGHAALDDAALRVAEVYRFSPAKNREVMVGVWVSFPITFQVR